MDRTDRLHALAEELRVSAPHPRSVAELAGRFGVDVRVVERDLARLRRSGIPVVPVVTGPAGSRGYTIDLDRLLPPLNLTAAEASAVAILLGRAADAPFAGSVRSALLKIVASMSASGDAETRELAGRIRYLVPAEPAGEEAGRAPAPAVVEDAAAARRVVRFTYVDRLGRETCRDVEPVALVSGPRERHLIGWCRLRGAPRIFRIGRIRDASLLDEATPARDYTGAEPSVPDLVAHALASG